MKRGLFWDDCNKRFQPTKSSDHPLFYEDDGNQFEFGKRFPELGLKIEKYMTDFLPLFALTRDEQ